MKKLSFFNCILLCAVTMSMSSLSGCTDKEDIVNSTDFEEKLAEFNFSTSQDKSFDLSLGINAKNNVVNLYGESVTLETAANSDSFLGSFFLNGDGCFIDTLKVPNHVTKVWMTFPNSPEFGVVTADVNDGKIVLDQKLGGLKSKSASRRAANATTTTDSNGNITTTSDEGTYTLYNYKDKVIVDYTADGYKTLSDYKKDQMGGIYGLFYWEPTYGQVDGVNETRYHYGGFDDNNNLMDSNTDLAGKGSYFQKRFKTLVDQNAFQNVQDDIINIDIIGGDEETIDEHGAIKTVTHEKVELSMTFLTEQAAFCNCFGYYYYKTDSLSAPKNVQEGMLMDKYIIFPNASLKDNPFTLGTVADQTTTTGRYAYKQYGPINSGDRVKLLFKDPETGEVSTWFPAGYTVGFFLVANAYDIGWKRNGSSNAKGVDYSLMSHLNFSANSSFDYPDRAANVNTYPICSNVKMNNSYQPSKLRYVSFNETVGDEEYIIFGVEDNTDFSYTDMVFTIESSDPWMTHRNRLTEWTESKAAVGVYAFEDVWPEGTDYDMNDALISHTRTRTFDSENYLSEVTDYFEIISDIDAAALSNTFCIQIPTAQQGSEITFDGDIQTEPETNSFIIFKNINEAINSGKKKVSITRKFNEKNIKADKLTYSPYLISNGATYMGQDRVEIHMAGDKVTTYGKKVYSDDKSNWYTSRFISGDGLYPYAITIPLKYWNSPDHNIRISETFTKFHSWVLSLGKNDKDWYQNAKGYDIRVTK